MLLLLAMFGACDADCDNPGRVNGSYAVFHDVLNVGDSATEDSGTAKAEGGKAVADNYDSVSYSTFINGWTHWDLTWSSGTGKVAIIANDAKERMGDPGAVIGDTFTWTGSLAATEDNCNTFDLSVKGTWSTSLDTDHSFKYDAQLTWTGDGMGGTYTYSDTYTQGDNLDPVGGITNAKGEAFFVAQGDGFDTGF